MSWQRPNGDHARLSHIPLKVLSHDFPNLPTDSLQAAQVAVEGLMENRKVKVYRKRSANNPTAFVYVLDWTASNRSRSSSLPPSSPPGRVNKGKAPLHARPSSSRSPPPKRQDRDPSPPRSTLAIGTSSSTQTSSGTIFNAFLTRLPAQQSTQPTQSDLSPSTVAARADVCFFLQGLSPSTVVCTS